MMKASNNDTSNNTNDGRITYVLITIMRMVIISLIKIIKNNNINILI